MHEFAAAYAAMSTTVLSPLTGTLPVALLIGDEAFVAEKPLQYTATFGKSGIAKQAGRDVLVEAGRNLHPKPFRQLLRFRRKAIVFASHG